MNRIVLGAFGALVLVAVGLFWLQGRAEVEAGAPPPVTPTERPTGLPSADVAGLQGPAPPEATELSREQLLPHVEVMRELGVQRIVFSGGEALMHSNLFALCELLREIDRFDPSALQRRLTDRPLPFWPWLVGAAALVFVTERAIALLRGVA